MPRANLASGHFEREQAGESERILKNMYAEENAGDPARPIRLVTSPGTVDRDPSNTITGTIRGMAQSDAFAPGKIIIVDGGTVRLWDIAAGTLTALSGIVSGTDRVDIAFTQTEMAILSGGNLYTSAGSSIAQVSDPDLPANITSLASLGQRILMTADNGQWYYTDVLDADSIQGSAFYTAESAPDDLVCVRVVGELAYLCGTRTIEPWYYDGVSTTDPFSRASNVIQRGVLTRDSVFELQNMLHFVADDFTVMQLAGTEPLIISKPWVVRMLKAVNISDIICAVYEDENHAFYSVNTPNGCAVYDLASKEWHLRESNGQSTWDWVRIVSKDGKHYVSKRTGSTFCELSRDYATDEETTVASVDIRVTTGGDTRIRVSGDTRVTAGSGSTLGTDIPRQFTAHIPHDGGRPAIGAIHLEGSKGRGNASGDGSDPVAGLRISNDNGNTFSARRTRNLGAQGAYDERTKWERNGRGKRPQTVLWFDVDEPVKFDITGVVYGEAS